MGQERRCIVCRHNNPASVHRCRKCRVSTTIGREALEECLRRLGGVLADEPLDDQHALFLAVWTTAVTTARPSPELATWAIDELQGRFGDNVATPLHALPEPDRLDACLVLAFFLGSLLFGVGLVADSSAVAAIGATTMSLTSTGQVAKTTDALQDRRQQLRANGRRLAAAQHEAKDEIVRDLSRDALPNGLLDEGGVVAQVLIALADRGLLEDLREGFRGLDRNTPRPDLDLF